MAQSKGRQGGASGVSAKSRGKKTSATGSLKSSGGSASAGRTSGRNASGRKSSGRGTTRKISSARGANGKRLSSSASQYKTAGRSASKRESEIRRDVGILVTLGVSILLFLSCIGLAGPVGSVLASLLFGIFGIPAYVFPFLLLYLVIFLMANAASADVTRRVIALLGLYVFICAFAHLILSGYEKNAGLLQIFRECSKYHTGGGILGGVFVLLFGNAFGLIGAYVIIILALVIFSLLLTQKSLFSLIRDRSEYLYDTRDIREQEREERRLIRQEKKDAAIARKEREAALRMKTRERQAAAEETTRLARRVEPQTIPHHDNRQDSLLRDSSTNAKTTIPAASLAPIISEIQESGNPDPSFDPDTGEILDNGDGTDQEFLITPEAIPDDIISNGMKGSVAASHAADTKETIEPDHAAPDTTRSEQPDEPEPVEDEEIAPAGKNHSEENSEITSEKQERSRKAKPSSGTAEEIQVPEMEEEVEEEYVIPPIDLLNPPKPNQRGDSNEHLKATAAKLQQTLHNFGVEVTINHISCGPTVTQYELTPQMGVKVSKILSLQDDIKLNLAATDVRIEAPIPGKAAIGIEVPNKTNTTVSMRELLESEAFRNAKSKLAICVGKDIAGQPVIADIAKMPHLLIAGATGSGKSVCINTFIMSILYKSRPDEVKFIMIDPKVVELSVYNGIPHLLIPVVTDPKKAAGALNWAVSEMTDRYQKFADMGVRDLKGYNEKVEAMPPDENGKKPKKMFRIVIVVDELADLMMVAQNEVEDAICRLAQLARACGIHLIIATQRPSVNVITGLIKANMPSRIALSVTSGVDSRTIIDMNGAEKLLGKGDMLFYPQGYQKPARIQGAFLTDEEIANVVHFLKENHKVLHFTQENMMQIQEAINKNAAGSVSPGGDAMDTDSYFTDAGKLIIEKDKASIGMLQRAFRIGFNRAARIMDQLCDAGVVGEEEGTKPRKVLMSMEQFENYLEEN
ncbi:MAG: DNA translocase FtsK [Bilifractor sp.]|nr:DNA translocase FtsK [Lachnospiraceae bacterium]MDY2836846.1 DNA translocase FtsK [Bilifractor sp.]